MLLNMYFQIFLTNTFNEILKEILLELIDYYKGLKFDTFYN